MLDLGIGYMAVMAHDESGRITSIIARLQVSEGPLQAVIWNAPLRAWTYDPDAAAPFVFDDRYFHRRSIIDQVAAERIARETLLTELPNEAELRRICEAGRGSS